MNGIKTAIDFTRLAKLLASRKTSLFLERYGMMEDNPEIAIGKNPNSHNIYVDFELGGFCAFITPDCKIKLCYSDYDNGGEFFSADKIEAHLEDRDRDYQEKNVQEFMDALEIFKEWENIS